MLGVTTLQVQGRWPLRRAYVFEEHRLALPCWAEALREANAPTGALLVTFDRHFDLVPALKPPTSTAAAELERWVHHAADPRNVDHIVAAMELGLIGDAIVVARSRPKGCLEGDRFVDSRGGEHRVISAPALERLPGEALSLAASAKHTVLDFDLDCFTTLCDADPTSVVPWPVQLIREQLLPKGSEPFWAAVAKHCVGLTFAREANHCGGLVAGGRLFEAAAQVVFVELLGADLP